MSSSLSQAATFICRHPKSGTSSLASLLDSHPQLVVYLKEMDFFRRFKNHAQDLRLDGQVEPEKHAILHIFQWEIGGQAGYPDRDYSTVRHERAVEAYDRWMDLLGVACCNILLAAILVFGEVTDPLTPPPIHWVEKTQYNEHFAEWIYSWWPEARCIHIVRDPRDNFASCHRKHPEWKAEIFALSWRRSSHQGRWDARQYGANRCLLLRTEDLVQHTEHSITQVRSFSGIRGHPILRQPTRVGQAWRGNSMFGKRHSGINDNLIGRYRQALNRSDIARLEAAFESNIRWLGCEIEGPISIPNQASWRLLRFRSAWGNLRRSVRHQLGSTLKGSHGGES